MSDGSAAAFPQTKSKLERQISQNPLPEAGLSKREYFAGLAMQGIISNPAYFNRETVKHRHDIANALNDAVVMADDLIAALEKK